VRSTFNSSLNLEITINGKISHASRRQNSAAATAIPNKPVIFRYKEEIERLFRGICVRARVGDDIKQR